MIQYTIVWCRTICSTEREVSHGKSLSRVAAFCTMKRTRTMQLGMVKRRRRRMLETAEKKRRRRRRMLGTVKRRRCRKRKDRRSEDALGLSLDRKMETNRKNVCLCQIVLFQKLQQVAIVPKVHKPMERVEWK